MWGVLNLESMTHLGFWYTKGVEEGHSAGIDWATIIFLAGMMIMVEGMAKVGFFRWLCMTLAKLVKYKTTPIFLVFMVMSAVLAMFIDSICGDWEFLLPAAVWRVCNRNLQRSTVFLPLQQRLCMSAAARGSPHFCLAGLRPWPAAWKIMRMTGSR